jgi:hypothetical protein
VPAHPFSITGAAPDDARRWPRVHGPLLQSRVAGAAVHEYNRPPLPPPPAEAQQRPPGFDKQFGQILAAGARDGGALTGGPLYAAVCGLQ